MAPTTNQQQWNKGDLVWVRQTSLDACRLQQVHEEAGVVVELGCEYHPPEENDTRSTRTTTKRDGVMVKLQVSNTRGIYPPSWLRSLEDDKKDKKPQGRKTSSRTTTVATTPVAVTSRRRTARSAVTPSPMASSAMSPSDSDSSIQEEEEEEDTKPTKKNTTRNKSQPKRTRSNNNNDDDNGDNDKKPASKKTRKSAVAAEGTNVTTVAMKVPTAVVKKKPVVKVSSGATTKVKSKGVPAKKSSTKVAVVKKETGKNTNKSPKVQLIVASESSEAESEEDSDDDEDRPFRVEYSPSGRAACRSCDERIDKGAVRICHRPLFRGQPGFVNYRHLNCATFEENVHQKEDIGGWRKLRKADQQALADRIEVAKEILEKENAELEPDELVQVAFQGEMRKAPEGLDAGLLPFQVEGVSWMYHQEVHMPELRGGILADEMGMGKTIQTITTILDNRPKLQHCKPGAKHPPSAPDLEARNREESLWEKSLESWHHEMKMANVPPKLLPKAATKTRPAGGARAGTLVVCPVIALTQWKEEIEKFTNGTALTICTYHGPNRAKEYPRELLVKYDIVLTTYQVIESEFRKMVSPNKVKCPNCGGSFKVDKLRVHLKYFCGEGAQRTEAQARQRRGNGNMGGRGGGGGGSGGGTSSQMKKSGKKSMSTKNEDSDEDLQSPAMTKGKTKPPAKRKSTAAKRPFIRLGRSKGYDSDSDLSLPENVVALSQTTSRPSRSAAKMATKKLSASAKEWSNANSGGESDEGYSSDNDDESSQVDSEDGSSAEDEPLQTMKRSKASNKKPTTKKKAVESSSDSEDDDDDDDEAIQEALKKQKLALERAKKTKSKGNTIGNKKLSMTAKGKKDLDKKEAAKKKVPPKGKQSGKRKKPPSSESSSDEDSDSDGDDQPDVDPLEGINMEKLIEEAMAGSRVSVLHTFTWWRIVLDEAHNIKSRSSGTAAASFSLTAIHRWCLSGTPLQNRVGELYSLIRFLRIDPMAHYFCRKEGCDCKSIHYRMQQGRCQDCGHGSIQHFSHFNKHVLNPIQRGGYQGDGRRAMMKLKNDVLDKSLLRRTKQSRAEDMNLPPRVVTIRAIRLHPREEDFYNALYTQTKSSFDDYVQEGTLLNNYAHIFDLLTKMRQAVDHPYLIVYSKKNQGRPSVQDTPAIANGSVDCDLCNELPTDRIVSSCCGAAFCRSCVMDYMSPALENAGRDVTRCPSCRAPFSIDLQQASSDVVDDGTLTVEPAQGSEGNDRENMPSLKEMTHVASGSILRRINLAEFATSTKVEALIQELVQMRQERPGSKALVFSQFVNMLDLIRWRLHSDPCLQDLGLGVRIIHGGMNIQSRDASLKDFREDPSVRVLLMSLKAGGVALNLTVANEAYLMDPWWNPAAEYQAIDRTHRLGQYRPIRAVRFIAEGTVEERVLQLQEKKRLVFDGTVGRDAASLKMLTVEDMKQMFA